MNVKKNNPSAIGTQADMKAGVDIGKVYGGYFSDSKNTQAFIDIGISPFETELPKRVVYVDFGGGQGLLTQPVVAFLESRGHDVDATVADANESYLMEARNKGLAVRACNLEMCDFTDLDLITMRAVLHYNSPIKQQEIFKQVCASLKVGGFLVHQVSSGSETNSRLRSAIVNIPALGRAGFGQYHWTSEKETVRLHEQAGFSETKVSGYAPPNAWGPEEQWERFNAKDLVKARAAGDATTEQKLLTNQKLFLSDARTLIESYLKDFGPEETGVEQKTDGTYHIHYTYPIIVSKK